MDANVHVGNLLRFYTGLTLYTRLPYTGGFMKTNFQAVIEWDCATGAHPQGKSLREVVAMLLKNCKRS